MQVNTIILSAGLAGGVLIGMAASQIPSAPTTLVSSSKAAPTETGPATVDQDCAEHQWPYLPTQCLGTTETGDARASVRTISPERMDRSAETRITADRVAAKTAEIAGRAARDRPAPEARPLAMKKPSPDNEATTVVTVMRGGEPTRYVVATGGG